MRVTGPAAYDLSNSQNKIWGTMKTGTPRYDLNRCYVRNNKATTSKGEKYSSIDIMKSYMCDAHVVKPISGTLQQSFYSNRII